MLAGTHLGLDPAARLQHPTLTRRPWKPPAACPARLAAAGFQESQRGHAETLTAGGACPGADGWTPWTRLRAVRRFSAAGQPWDRWLPSTDRVGTKRQALCTRCSFIPRNGASWKVLSLSLQRR